MSEQNVIVYRGHEIRMLLCLSTTGMTEQFCVYDDLGVVFVTHSLRSAKRFVADRCQREARNAHRHAHSERTDNTERETRVV